jgi:hypothetical protein
MKSPREVLFEKHQGIESKLDTIRAEALAEVAGGKVSTAHEDRAKRLESQGHWFVELIRSLRPHFAGIAFMWLVILGFHFATTETSSPVLAATTAPSPEIIANLKEQKRLYSQLIGTAENSNPVEPAMHERRPRSEVRQYVRIV